MKKQIQQAMNRRLTSFWKNPQEIPPESPENPQDLRTLRKGIPHKTRTIPTLNGFLIENLRGPAVKLGCTVVIGHTEDLPVISSRVKAVLLYAKQFFRAEMFDGASYVRPPRLPGNVTLEKGRAVPSGVGILIPLCESGIDCGTIEFVNGARVMGPVELVKPYLKGRKFFILNRHKDFICTELA